MKPKQDKQITGINSLCVPNLVIVGFTSCGKSSAGRALAKATGAEFVDLDTIIEQLYNDENKEVRSCREIYRIEGKSVFRNFETRAVLSLKDRTGIVLATGGGAVRTPENRQALKGLGYVVYLKTSPEIIYKRMQISKGVPAYLADDASQLRISEAWTLRDPVYTAMSDIIVKNDNISPEAAAAAIIAGFEKIV
jgi:shikimate kinase